jgi:hypothetical protein
LLVSTNLCILLLKLSPGTPHMNLKKLGHATTPQLKLYKFYIP